MRKLVQKMVLVSILVSGTQVITLPVGDLTIFQISLILTISLGVVGIIERGNIYTGKYLSFTLVYFISSFLAWAISTNPSWAKSYLFLGLMTAAIVFIISNYFEAEDISLLEKTIVRSQYIVFPFAIYNIIMFYFRGGMPNHIDLFAGMSIYLDDDSLLRGQASSQIRLMLPYATPPVLSVAMAICIIILFTNKSLYKPGIRRLLIGLYGLILVFTGSRTGMVGLGLVLVFTVLRKLFYNKEKIKTRHVMAILLGALLITLVLFFTRNNIYIVKMFHRFTSLDIMNDRHFLVPLDGLIIWVGTLKNFIFGIGFGSSSNMMGAHTYLPPYFLNSFVTLLAERGIFGLSVIVILINLVRSLFAQTNFDKANGVDRYFNSLALSLLTGLLSCIFYEALNCYLLVFVIAISFMADRTRVIYRKEK